MVEKLTERKTRELEAIQGKGIQKPGTNLVDDKTLFKQMGIKVRSKHSGN